MNTGAPGAPFRLQITSNATGSAQAFSIESSLSGGRRRILRTTRSVRTDTTGVTGTATADYRRRLHRYALARLSLHRGQWRNGRRRSDHDRVVIGLGPDRHDHRTDQLRGSATHAWPTESTIALGTGTLKPTTLSAHRRLRPPDSAGARCDGCRSGNQIITASSNQVSNAINGVTLNLNGTGGPSVVSVAPDLTTEASQISAVRNGLQHRRQATRQQYPGGTESYAPPLANDGGLRLTLFQPADPAWNIESFFTRYLGPPEYWPAYLRPDQIRDRRRSPTIVNATIGQLIPRCIQW